MLKSDRFRWGNITPAGIGLWLSWLERFADTEEVDGLESYDCSSRILSRPVILDPCSHFSSCKKWPRGPGGWQSGCQLRVPYNPLGALFFPAKKSDPLNVHLIQLG
jgi:hypothetical protein